MDQHRHRFLFILLVIVLISLGCSQDTKQFYDAQYSFTYEEIVVNNQNFLKIKLYKYFVEEDYDLFYTIDGTDPIENGVIYLEPIQINHPTTLKVVLKKDGIVYSTVSSHEIELIYLSSPDVKFYVNRYEESFDGPVDLNNDTWSIPVGETIELATSEDDVIHYTLDGSIPTLDSPKYLGPITITSSCTLSARRFPNNLSHFCPSESLVIEIIQRCSKPVLSISPRAILYDENRPTVSITSPEEAFIVYTVNESGPVLSSKNRLNYLEPLDLQEMPYYRINTIAAGKEGFLDSLQVTADYPVIGEAGGFLIYDKGEYQDGWRYLEVTPNNIQVSNGEVFCQTQTYVMGTPSGPNRPYLYIFGFNRTSPMPELVNYDDGKRNTEMLTEWYGDEAYISQDLWNIETTPYYAAKLCSDLNYGGFDDWFLPSIKEGKYIQKAFDNGLEYTLVSWFWAFGEGEYPRVFRYHRGWGLEGQSWGDENSVLAIRRF